MNANGLQSSQQHGVDSFRVTQLDHSQGPVDGSLYAQVNKRKLESQILQNGPSRLQNGGSYTSSQDSGISAFSGIVFFAPCGTVAQVKSNHEMQYNKHNAGERKSVPSTSISNNTNTCISQSNVKKSKLIKLAKVMLKSQSKFN